MPAGHRELEKLLELLDPRELPRLMRSTYYRDYFERAAAALVPLRPDVVHVMTSAQAGQVLRRVLPDARLVLHLHDDMLTRLPGKATAGHLEPFDAVVTCSDWLGQALRTHVPSLAGRIHGVGNGIDGIDDTGSSSPEVALPVRKLLMVGRISPEKGPHILLEAFRQLASRYPDLRVDIVGPLGLLPHCHARLMAKGVPAMAAAVRQFYGGRIGALRSQFFQPAKSLERRLMAELPETLHSRVRFLGAQPHDQMLAAYRDADVLVQPSVCREGFGLPVAEAMAAGLPVVAAGHGGLLDLVEHGRTGLLVPPGDAAALAGAIVTLAEHPDRARAFGLAGRERAARRFTWEVAARRLADVYADLIPMALPSATARAVA
ncbi:glycosyltransferase family 4 protein [Geminicoccus roseus]|uniref:glycosyltransferase family 4 protein n=1 Tax=Geminicoccus roseus TaxID=404900 RepID=UPI00146FC83A|nr:glycosyltransferase family 4 protein [Geminicoccus roseus]